MTTRRRSFGLAALVSVALWVLVIAIIVAAVKSR